jgi:hypothetical protein
MAQWWNYWSRDEEDCWEEKERLPKKSNQQIIVVVGIDFKQ